MSEVINFEEQRANELAKQQQSNAIHQNLEETYKKGKSFGKPSTLKYGVLFTLAIIIDVVGFFDLTGIGWFLGKLVTIPCFALSLGICWATNTKHAEAQDYVKTLSHRFHQIGSTGKYAIKQAASLLGRNPGMLAALGQGIDVVLPPVLSLIFLSTVWVYIAYRAEKKAYERAAEAAEQIPEMEQELLAA